MEPRLFHARTSSASYRVRIALALKGIGYVSELLDLRAGDNAREEYRHVNPMGQVPVLEIDGLRLIQSVAIIEYLDETRPSPPLLPADPAGRAAARSLVEVINSGIQPLHNFGVLQRLGEQFGARTAGAVEWTRYWADRRLRALDVMLTPLAGRYCMGDAVTLPDVFLFPQIAKLAEFEIGPADCTAISRVVDNLRALPAFAGTGPDSIPATAP